MKILLIEDNPGDARLIELMLRESSGMQLQTAGTLREGLEILERDEVDLVLLDLGLPDSHGLETLCAAREATRQIPIVALTGNKDEEMALAALQSGAQDYLVKGDINAGALKRVIRYAIERKRAEQALMESERKHQQLLGLIQEGVWATNENGITTYVNQGMARMLGCEESEILGRSFIEFVGEEQREAAWANLERRRQGIVEKHESQFIRKDGSTLHALLSTSPIHDEEGRFAGSMALVTDVTEQHRLQEQLLRAQRLDSIGQLAGGVAHDFNNLLSIVIGYGDVILGKLLPDSPLRSKVESIVRAGERGAALARQLLIFSCKQKAEPTALDLGNVFADFQKMLRRLIGENIELNQDVQEDIWAIKADPTLMEQVIMNLSINARDAMPQGGSLSVRMQNVSHLEPLVLMDTAVPPGDYVRLSVSDSGCGIPESVRTRLYEPFFTTKPVGKGTGLGLAVVYGIVKQAGGYIACESQEGKGTTFYIWIPRFGKSADRRATDVANVAPPKGRETILVVEDQPELLTMIRDALKDLGYKCLKAQDGDEALSIARRHSVQLLLTDIVLPTLNGHQLAEQICESKPEMKVVYMSGYQFPDETGEADAAANGRVLLKKPFPLPLLAKTVREALDRVSPIAGVTTGAAS